MKLNFTFLLFILSFATQATATHFTDTVKLNPGGKPMRYYFTERIKGGKPRIDGKLGDSCWQFGHWGGDFTQWIPAEGKRPSQPTYFKVLYDDQFIYVAFKVVDSVIDKAQFRTGMRDAFAGDLVGICFDSYHDFRTGFEFDITAAGQQMDAILTNPMIADVNWNAVWYSKTAKDDTSWTAEMQIPLSQLRYSRDAKQVWGLHIWRWINRLQEESDWELQSMTGPGILYLFGEMHGIENLPRSKRLEMIGSGLSKLNRFPKQAGNPYASKGRAFQQNLGLYAKLGLSSNFTMDLTLNPDFGQVEADASVINLSAFEVFFEEKRPFFLEGKNIFQYEMDESTLFYSRRIGHSPSYTPALQNGEFLQLPEQTTILSALKVSGKNKEGLSVGLLQSVTANEEARIWKSGTERTTRVEPLSSYTVARVQKDYNEGNTFFGGMFTAVNRAIQQPHLNFLAKSSYTAGLDLLHQWKDKEYFVEARLLASDISGDTLAMQELQHSSARYYQRSDRYRYDSSLTSLSGMGGKIKVGKGSKGFWRYSTELSFRTPGLELNDLGYMQKADLLTQQNMLSYFVNQPVGIFRSYTLGSIQLNQWDFSGNFLGSGFNLNAEMSFKNKWQLVAIAEHLTAMQDNQLLRGGPAFRVTSGWNYNVKLKSDQSKPVSYYLGYKYTNNGARGSYWHLAPGVVLLPFQNLKISSNLQYGENTDDLQFVENVYANKQIRYVLGRIKQRTLSATFRIDYNLTPKWSLQYYGSPFASTGSYSHYKMVSNPMAAKYEDRFVSLASVHAANGRLEADENRDGIADFGMQNPEFNFFQFRSNLVLRWEYRAGSQLYLVWNNERTSYLSPGGNRVTDLAPELGRVSPRQVFLLKFNYWFSL